MNYFCATPEDTTQLPALTTGCDSWLKFIPDTSNNYQNTPVLKIRLNFHFLRDDTGGGIFQNPQESNVTQTILWLNSIYKNLDSAVLKTTPPAEYIDDSRIRFEEYGIYYHYSDQYYDTNVICEPVLLDTFGVNIDSVINIFYYKNSYGGPACGPETFVNMPNGTHSWASVQVLGHELGHAVWCLSHTWSGNCGDDDFDDTYYPDFNKNWVGCGVDTVFYDEDCCPPPDYLCTGVSNNIMGYNICRNYLSPKQMGYMHWINITNPSKRKYISYTYDPNEPEIIIKDDAIWDVYKVVNSNIIIDSGSVLTIKCTVYFSPHVKIVVKKGGKLIMDGGTLTSHGPGFWEGVYVEGDPSLSQIPVTNQGVIEIVHGGTIEYAEEGVLVMGPSVFKGGGIIRADSAIFHNNKIGIFMAPYQNFISSTNDPIPNISYIKNSQFIVDMNYFFKTTTFRPRFLQLHEVDGIKIFANNFYFNGTSAINPDMRPDGILAFDASFYVSPICADIYTPCDNWNKNQFTWLNYGIRVMNSSPNITVTVNRAMFVGVYRGIFLNGVTNATITLNKLEIPDINNNYTDSYNDPYVDIQPYGIYLNECNAYTVEENEFEDWSSLGEDQGTYGIIVNNSYDPPNEIYNNDLQDLECGILALGDNRSIDDPILKYSTGLKILCNDNTNNHQDIDVRDEGYYRGIAEYQGYDIPFKPSSPAGNTFSHTCQYPYTFADYDNEYGREFKYYHHKKTGLNPVWIPDTLCYSDNIILNETQHNYDSTTACPTKIDSSNSSPDTPLSDVYNDLNSAKQSKNSSKLMLDIWKDGGDTEQLELEVELALPPESYQLYNSLLGDSPYLSDDVLIAAIENEDVLTSLMIKLLMIANPHSTRSEDVIDALYSRTNPLPESWIDEIISGTAYTSQLEHLEAAVSYDYHNYKMIIDDLKTRYINDTINLWAEDSLINLLSREEEINLRYELAFHYLDKGQYQSMNNVLNNLSYEFDFTEEQTDIHQHYINYLSLLKTMRIDSIQVADLDSLQIDTLQIIVDNCNHYPAGWARSLLQQLNTDQEYWYREPITPDQLTLRRSKHNTISSDNGNIDQLKVYPNPANDYFTLDYCVKQVYHDQRVEIADVVGRIIYTIQLSGQKNQQLIDIQEYKTGIYFINLIGDGKIIESEKLSITRQ